MCAACSYFRVSKYSSVVLMRLCSILIPSLRFMHFLIDPFYGDL